MAAIQTTLTLRDDTSKRLKIIEKRVRSLAKTMGAFNNGVVTSGKRMETLAKRVEKVATATQKLGSASKDVNKLNKSLNNTSVQASSAKSSVDGLVSSVKRLAVAYLGFTGIGTILDTADKITGATNKLSTVHRMENPNASDAETRAVVADQMDDVFASAQRSRADYNATMQNVGKMLINAGATFEGNLDKAIAFNELMSKTYTIGGASAVEQETSMYQLIQALGSGTLAGDELRSVREGAQVAYKYIEEYAQALYNTKTSLKDLASEGLITSEIVTNAILKNADAINQMFDDTQVTFEQTMTMMKNNFTKAFEPVLQKLTTLLNNEEFQEMLAGITSAFVVASNVILDGMSWIARAWGWVTNLMEKHRNAILGTLVPALAVLIGYYIVMGTIAVISFIATNWIILLVLASIVLLMFAFLKWGDIVGEVIGWIVGIFWGLVIAIWDGILIMTNLALFLGNVFAGVGAVIVAVFQNAWVDIQTGWYACVEGVLRGVKWIVDALNKIPGVSIDTGGLTNKINDAAHKKADAWASRQSYSEAWDKGYKSFEYYELVNPIEEGKKVKDKTSDFISESSDKVNEWLNNLLGKEEKKENLFGGKDWETTIGNALDGSGTGDNIGNIADSIELTKEDLEYLRELAEMEVINRFTTAEIKVDMSNYNTISGENDLDGLVEKLSVKLEEEMHIVAEGTY